MKKLKRQWRGTGREVEKAGKAKKARAIKRGERQVAVKEAIKAVEEAFLENGYDTTPEQVAEVIRARAEAES